MQDELINLQDQMKKTMVFITHDFLEAIKMGDHIAIMKDGEISQIGTPEEIVANPVNDYVRDFTEDVPRYKVLSAGKVMRKITGQTPAAGIEPVLTSAKIDSLIGRVADTDMALPVVDPAGQMVGEIDRSIVMHAMMSKS
jgi:glycine betaine/proline transport system ATP-binding protein